MLPISIIITVKNEEKNILELFESLKIQERPFEVVMVDSESSDRTVEIAKKFKDEMDLKIIIKKSTRGEGRNIGVMNSKYEYVLFIDGDSYADRNWVSEMRKSFDSGCDFVAGKTISIGKNTYTKFGRVELFYRGIDVTYPSCNLGYKKILFLRLKGFDEIFITAEDIDLNMRSLDIGARFCYNEHAVVYNKVRDDIGSFLRQAYWNGYGRAQLNKKHGNVWKMYSIKSMVETGQFNLFGIARLMFAITGYIRGKVS
ncbi:MAG: glycosyltransferase [Thermoplasmata archaeon]